MRDEMDRRTYSIFKSFSFLLGTYRLEYMFLLLLASLNCAVEGILHPLLIKEIFDAAVSRGDFNHFITLIIGYLILGLVMNVTGYSLSLWQTALDNRITHRVSVSLLESFYKKDYRDVLREGDGYYVARIRSDVKDGVVPMLAQTRSIVMEFVRFLALMSVVIFISWKAFLLLSVIIPISSAVSILVGRKIRSFTTQERDQEASVLATLTKSISAFKIVKNFDLTSKTLNSFDVNIKKVLISGYQKYRVIRMLRGANDLTMVVSDFCSLLVGALFVFRQQMTFGAYLAFMNSFWRSATTLMEIFSKWADLNSYGVIINRVVEFSSGNGAISYYLKGSEVSATNMSYRYTDNEVISKFSIRLNSGERVLIVGPNGSGKTTLANILSGHLTPSEGDIVLPERISSITLPVCFPPIRASELGIDIEYFEKFSINSADIMNSYADELSAGQQQKLALALALSKEADLYVLDEPLANLDAASRSIALQTIFERTKNKILIMIMHGAEEHYKAFDRVIHLGRNDSDMNVSASSPRSMSRRPLPASE